MEGPPNVPEMPRQVARFLLAGGVAAAVNVSARYLLTPVVGYRWSIVLAFVVGLTTAWLLFRRYVFGPSDGSRAAEYLRFGVVNLIALAQVWVVSVLLADHVFPFVGFHFHPYTVAHVNRRAVADCYQLRRPSQMELPASHMMLASITARPDALRCTRIPHECVMATR